MQHGANFQTLARLHAALDSVVETEHMIAAIKQGSPTAPRSVQHVADLLGQARELLRYLLTPVGSPGSST
jgi:hypothetical protein